MLHFIEITDQFGHPHLINLGQITHVTPHLNMSVEDNKDLGTTWVYFIDGKSVSVDMPYSELIKHLNFDHQVKPAYIMY